MAYELTHDQDWLYLKTVGKMTDNQYRYTQNVLREIPQSAYRQDIYTWRVPKSSLDTLVDKMEDLICWNQPVEDIRGEPFDNVQEFPILEDFSTMKLEPYPYQKVGISFLVHNKKGLIGDTMGLGKSCQALGAFHHLHKEGKVKRMLVICPASLKYQWHDEVGKFTDHTSLVIDGTAAKRRKQWASSENYDIVIANYETVRGDLDTVKSLDFDVITCDEAHKMKNRASKTFKALIQLDADYKFALTGTPMQNRPEEVHALMSFVDDNILGGITQFRKDHIVYGEKFGRKFVAIGAKRLGELRQKIAPHMVRRMKDEVAPDLPPLIESEFPVQLSKEQRRIMDNIQMKMDDLSKEMDDYFRQNPDAKRFPGEEKVMGYLNMMIAAADDPRLLLMSESAMVKQMGAPGAKASQFPKIEAIFEIAEEAIAGGERKIFIFTKFARMKELIDKHLKMRFGDAAVTPGIHGRMQPYDRQQSLKQFENDDNAIFFVCTDAANFGLNAAFCPLLINVDQDWNPSIREQRNGRIHRINGELDRYRIVDLVALDSIDEVVLSVINKKKQLGETIVGKSKAERENMERLLKMLGRK